MPGDPGNEAQQWDVDHNEYHACHTRTSNSMLQVFRASRPKYHGRFVSHTMDHPDPSDAMIKGSLTGDNLLDTRRFLDHYTCEPATIGDGETLINKRKPAHRVYLADWAVDVFEAGQQVVTPKQMDAALSMAEAVRANTQAMRLLDDPGEAEYAITWTDVETGIPRKAMIDWLRDAYLLPDGTIADIIVDVKTTKDIRPAAFARAALKRGYHCQFAGYQDATECLFGVRRRVVLVAVHNEPPWEVACYELSDHFLDIGRERNRSDLAKLSKCMASGIWTNPEASQVTQIDAPRYAEADQDWEIEG